MSKTQHWLPILLSIILTQVFLVQQLYAQSNVNIIINGVNNELEENIRLYLSLEQQKDHALFSDERIRRLFKKSHQEISKAVQPYGFYRAEIHSKLEQIEASQWQATYTINSGKAIPIHRFDFNINEAVRQDLEFKSVTDNPPFKMGDTFNHLKYENFKNSLAKVATERGYFDARFTSHQVEVNLNSYEANIKLHFNAGQRYQFGEIIFDSGTLKPELLKRYLTFEQGSPYSIYDLLKLQQSLTDSEYFKSVEISPGTPESDTLEVPVNIKLTPRKKHRYSLGLGYGTDTGARAKFSWEIPRLNASGHRINTDTRVSDLGYSLDFRYRVPLLKPRTDELVYSAGIVNEKTDTNESTIRTVGSSINRSHGYWRESLALNYQQEDFTVADEQGRSSLLIPTFNWSRIWGSNFIYTLDGLRFNIGIRGASEKLISDSSFFQLQSSLKAISKLGKKHRLIARGQLGSTWTDDFLQLPSSVRFFAGGAQSVRGYAYESLGPVNSSGEVIGGQHLMIGSLEVEHALSEKWAAAIFYDAGNAIDNFNDKLERGAGVGIRWKSPIGAIRVDLATAISDEDRPWRIHINIGPDL